MFARSAVTVRRFVTDRMPRIDLPFKLATHRLLQQEPGSIRSPTSAAQKRLNGVHRNPRTVDLPQAEPIDAQYREKFLASVEPILEELERFKRTQVATVAQNDDQS